MRNNYEYIAPFYDLIVKCIFGTHIQQSQTSLLNELPEKGKILFIGGGSGRTLKKIVTLRPELIVDYVDASTKMIEESKAKLSDINHNVNFVVGTENHIPSGEYDAILTFYFLDLFETKKRTEIFQLLNKKLKTKGGWLIADFNVPVNRLQRLVETLMFLFLKLATQIESSRIEDYKSLFNPVDFELVKEHEFYWGFIFSRSYRKQDGTIIG